MECLPYEINNKILGYLYGCRKNNKEIFNKESKKNFFLITKKCENIKILNHIFCKNCDKKKIWRTRMIMNNLLPG